MTAHKLELRKWLEEAEFYIELKKKIEAMAPNTGFMDIESIQAQRIKTLIEAYQDLESRHKENISDEIKRLQAIDDFEAGCG